MKIIILALSLTSFATGQLSHTQLEYYKRESGYCTTESEGAKKILAKAKFDDTKKHIARVEDDRCLITTLKTAVDAKTPPVLCQGAASPDRSACIHLVTEKLHAQRPFTAAGLTTMGAEQLTYIMSEKKEMQAAGKTPAEVSLATDKKLFRYLTQSKKFSLAFAKPDPSGTKKSPELEFFESREIPGICKAVHKLGDALIAKVAKDPASAAGTAKEKAEYEAQAGCIAPEGKN